MNAKNLSYLILLLLICDISLAQDISTKRLPDEWTYVYVSQFGSIEFPPTMEIQAGEYKRLNDKHKLAQGVILQNTDLIIQQKYLNTLQKKGFEKYARILIEISSEVDMYEKRCSKIGQCTPSEFMALQIEFKLAFNEMLNSIGHEMRVWYPFETVKIHNMTCLHISYIRQLKNNPEVFVNTYKFFYNDMMYSVTLSYRVNETNYWQKDFKRVLESLSIVDTCK